MSHELRLRLPGPLHQQLQALAEETDQALTRTALQLLTNALHTPPRKGRLPAASPATSQAGSPQKRALCLLPAPLPDQEIAPATWQAIVALHGRYPRQLENLKTGWWKHPSHAETLTALANWRAELDTTPDHLQELAYQHQLDTYAHRLREDPGGTADRWDPTT
jgi:hypothetical protein